MKNRMQGWALLEIVVAMAVMGVAASVVITMQLHSLAVIQRSLQDAQSLGLAREILETQAMGMASATLETSWAEQLAAIDPKRTFELTATSAGHTIQITSPTRHSDDASARWQLPLVP